jgi:hypothetical protein
MPIITYAFLCKNNIEIPEILYLESYIIYGLTELFIIGNKDQMNSLLKDIFDTAINTMPSNINSFNNYYKNNDFSKSIGIIPKEEQIVFLKKCVFLPDTQKKIFDTLQINLNNIYEYLEYLLTNIKYNNVINTSEIINNKLKDYKKYNGTETIIIPGKNTFLFVYFPGYDEKLYGINKLIKFQNVINHAMIIIDWNDMWYKGSYDRIADTIKCYIKNYKITKTILFGQSMGGYMALKMSCYLDNIICISMSPQTFNRKKNNMLLSSSVKNFADAPIYINDIYDEIDKSTSNSKRYILVGISECNHGGYWGDLFFAGNLIQAKKTYILLVNQNIHPIYKNIKAESLRDLLINNYDILYNNPSEGLKILDKIEYFSDDSKSSG